jgi:hypothetical protein
MAPRVLIRALAAMVLLEGAARAGDASTAEVEAETVEDIAGGIVRNVRRAIAIGPAIGAFSTYALDGGALDGGISIGLEAELFRSAIPTPARVRELALQRAQARLARALRDRFGDRRPDDATLRQLAREIAVEVRAELVAELRGARPRLVERPRLLLGIEGEYLFGSSDGAFRVGFALGAGPLSLGPSFSVRFGDDVVARLGAELAAHVLPGASPRSPVLDVVLRADFELHARDPADDQITLGVRVLLDLI